MHFDPNDWQKLPANKPLPVGRKVEVRLKAPGELYVKAPDADEFVLYGYGSEFKFSVIYDGCWIKSTVAGVLKIGQVSSVERGDKPALTNEDKKPNYSAAEILVKQALRRMQLKEKALAAKLAQAASESKNESADQPADLQDDAGVSGTSVQPEGDSPADQEQP